MEDAAIPEDSSPHLLPATAAGARQRGVLAQWWAPRGPRGACATGWWGPEGLQGRRNAPESGDVSPGGADDAATRRPIPL